MHAVRDLPGVADRWRTRADQLAELNELGNVGSGGWYGAFSTDLRKAQGEGRTAAGG